MKKFKYYIQLLDGIWSVPLVFFAFWFIGILIQSIFGYGTGSYDPAFIQPLLLATAVVIGATNAGVAGLYFTLRGLHRYIYGTKSQDKFINKSKTDWRHLAPLHRFCIALFVLFYFITLIVLVYLKLV